MSSPLKEDREWQEGEALLQALRGIEGTTPEDNT